MYLDGVSSRNEATKRQRAWGTSRGRKWRRGREGDRVLQPSGVQVADLSRESHPRDSLRFSLPEARHGGAVRVILRETKARISLFALLEDMSNRPSSFTAVEFVRSLVR